MAGNKKNLKFIKKIFVISACILFLVFLYINIVSSNKNKQASNSIINLEQYNDFEFYDILPKLKVLDDNKKVIENKKFNKIIVQIGIYKNYKYAESIKAQLLLIGLDSKIISSSNDKDTVFKVTLDPIDNQKDLDNVVSKLKSNEINYLLKK
tara:strand:+ start:3081 stop:3536 length:456 start_codon:yes stop_codon:yes gene_type:complete